MGKEYLVDTNVVIDFFNGSLPETARQILVDSYMAISFITQIEFLGTNKINDLERKMFEDFMTVVPVFKIDDLIIQHTIDLRTQCKIKLPDALIAATAISKQLILFTRNIDDFKSIPNLTVQNTYKL